jgi:hypothetical protein
MLPSPANAGPFAVWAKLSAPSGRQSDRDLTVLRRASGTSPGANLRRTPRKSDGRYVLRPSRAPLRQFGRRMTRYPYVLPRPEKPALTLPRSRRCVLAARPLSLFPRRYRHAIGVKCSSRPSTISERQRKAVVLGRGNRPIDERLLSEPCGQLIHSGSAASFTPPLRLQRPLIVTSSPSTKL